MSGEKKPKPAGSDRSLGDFRDPRKKTPKPAGSDRMLGDYRGKKKPKPASKDAMLEDVGPAARRNKK